MSYALNVERTIDAAPERIFDAFVAMYDSERPDWVTGSRLDLRPGGRWDVSFQVPDGPAFREERVLTALDRPHRLGYDMTAFYGPEPSLRTTVTVTVGPAPGGHRIRLAQDGFPDEQTRDTFASAWSDVLGELAGRLGQRPMKLLLTDSGIQNASIHAALVDLLGKPVEECGALIVPTALHAQPGGAVQARRVVSGLEDRAPMAQLGWKSLGLLELTALPSVGEDLWVPLVREADALLVEGGDPMYLCHWMRESGLAGMLPTLHDTVYVGLSAGSMVMTPCIGEDFVRWSPPGGGDRTLGLVDFAIFPHLDHPGMDSNTMANAEKWAATMPVRAYATDNQTAIKVTGGEVEVVSEGHWRLFSR